MKETIQIRYARDGHIARLTFDRPEVLNALSPTLIEETLQVTEEIAASDARVLILSGAGKSFSAGVDLKAASSPDYTKEVHKRFSEQARTLAVLFETMPQAVIAAVQGHCFTGALELALGCDFILAADDALFADTHGKLGLLPGWGLSQRLPMRIGVQRAKEMSYTGRRVGAAEAKEIGLILDHVPAERLEGRVNELAEQIAASNPNAVAGYKGLYRNALNHGLDEGLAFERTYRPARKIPVEQKPLSSFLKSS